MRKQLAIIIFSILIITSCSSIDKSIVGHWYIEELYYENAPVHQELVSIGLSFDKNKTCELPFTLDEYYSNTLKKGTWTTTKKGADHYVIINTQNPRFNGEFKIESLEKLQDHKSWGFYAKMVLVSSKSKIICIRQLYQ